MEERLDVLVIGRACVDYIAVVETFPAEDMKATLDERMVEGGGQGTNTACCIAKLGGNVRYVGTVGDDEEGRFCIKRLHDFGVDTASVRILARETTPVAYIFVTRATGRRTIIYEPTRLPPLPVDDDLMALIATAHVLLLDPSVTYLAPELMALKQRPVIVYDCERWKDGILDMMAVADYFIPSAVFLDDPVLALPGTVLQEKIVDLAHRIGGRLIVTDGEQGAYYLRDGVIFQVLPPAADIRDTTGAGDNFHAAFAMALSRGFDLPAAVKFAVAVATLSCRGYGGRAGLPDYREAMEAMQTVDETVLMP